MNRKGLLRAFQAVTGLLLGLVLLLWLAGPRVGAPEGADYFLPDPLPAPEFQLMSHEGELVTGHHFPDKLLVVFFGFTSCPDVCPLTLSHLARAFREMGEGGDRIQVLLVSVDPERDTPERLAAYLEAFHPSFLGLTGTEAEIRAVADKFGAFFARRGEGTDYTVDHTARSFVITPSGHIPLTFPVTATPSEMARDLSNLLERLS